MAFFDKSWYGDADLRAGALTFHEKYARQPSRETMADAKRLHTRYTDRLRELLVQRGVCSRLEYTGSSYEGVKVRNDLEFDVMVILQCAGTGFQIQEDEKPGYVKVRAQHSSTTQQTNKLITKALREEHFLSSDRLASLFMGELKQCVDQLEQQQFITHRIKLRQHGPAVQMDVKRGPTSDVTYYSVDMVPTLEIRASNGGNSYFVAKPIKGAGTAKPSTSWRESFSLKEKELIRTFGEANSCHKLVLRILKVIRNNEPGLDNLTSYHLKTAFFRVSDRLNFPGQWKMDCLGQRLMDVLSQLEQELGSGAMWHYFRPDAGINLLDGIGQVCVRNMHDRLRRLVSQKAQMMKVLQS